MPLLRILPRDNSTVRLSQGTVEWLSKGAVRCFVMQLQPVRCFDITAVHVILSLKSSSLHLKNLN